MTLSYFNNGLVVCLMGPTASGKSDVALRIAERFPVEIISVDSALVYRSMNIGTAKPSAEERAQVEHHLIDIRDPTECYSAADFIRDTRVAIAAVHSRGRIPLLVGGTMLYFRAWLWGLDELPPADPTIRAALDCRGREEGWPVLHHELAQLDAVTAARLAPHDTQRIQRALEVCLLTGKPFSSFLTTNRSDKKDKVLQMALWPADRSLLHKHIESRFENMMARGLVDEVQQLRLAWPALTLDSPAMRCVGYRQVLESMAGIHPWSSLSARGVVATRQLAKRQLTWLRSWPDLIRIETPAVDVLDKMCLQIETALASAAGA